MYSRGIRGAITIENDTPQDVEKATVELFGTIVDENGVFFEDISHVIFTVTKDIKSAYPAKFVRTNFDAKNVPLMCFEEAEIENSLTMCIRVLVVVNTEKRQDEMKHFYLGGAKVLRPDLSK